MLQTGPIILRFNGIFGVPVEIGQTLAFLLLLFAGFGLSAGGDMLWLITVVAMIIAIIYLHELGHAWASLVQGVPVRRIVLHGGGGFCEQARAATAREQEFIVAMGPIVNLGLWALGSLAAAWVWQNGSGSGVLGHYLSLFATLNLMFFIFNLIPVQPLDGGRLLQLFLLRFVEQKPAMRIAGGIGLICAVLWWPALLYVWFTTGWLLLFVPSIALHYHMMRGELRF
ncbi:site-2 protease family protein [Alisedimentitalea sp. MJ-SS2]|uniref:metalloprotease n=1 Tax=Aliisedimentitalea sp. MJ-SS2 TaxID=3049795 RepID=UPI002914FD56|nr:site-2 protease family protein [Alisedimentitalea sp. MJ-SS2]MDU8929871.1 site-2 protease family protein [Alisedimentitalea sp. MJ-SS2]